MYKARNDFAGLFDDVVNATKGMAQFNKETGEFEISGLELHRLREIANATGIEFEELAKATKEQAKYAEISSRISAFGLDSESKDFLASIATFDKAKKQYIVKIDGEEL
ncbi:MAG: hypothetical protein GTO02_14190, partial [Candidatus Dadabacteria bacterium]|nr:hypothetical protein [Candidatus Dadabacteria bacterium]